MKISNAPAVKREAEEESGKKRGENHDLGARGPFCLTLQNGGCLGPLQTDVEATLESARALFVCQSALDWDPLLECAPGAGQVEVSDLTG